MSGMERVQADGFHQLEEQCRELAQRGLWVLEALPRPRQGDVETEETLRRTCQYVNSALAELREIVQRVRELEGALLTAQATAAQRDEAAASAAVRVADADKRAAAADKKAAEADALIGRFAELKSGLEADRAEVQASMRQLASMLEAARKDTDALARKRSDLEESIRKAREMKKAAESAEQLKAQAEKDVSRLQKVKDGFGNEWHRLEAERRKLESDVDNYNTAAAGYRKLKADAMKDLREEQARVGRRDEAIAHLQENIKGCQQSMLTLKSNFDQEAGKVKERDRVIAEMRLDRERTLASELQARLSQASAEVGAAQKREASEYQGLLQKLSDMKLAQDQTLGSLQEDKERTREAMTSATRAMVEETAASHRLKTELSPNVRAVKTTVEQIGVMSKQLGNMEEAYAARQRDDAARARKHMVELIHEIDSQTRQQHEQELAEVRRRHEAQLTELRTTKDEELVLVRRKREEDLDSAREEVRQSQQVADGLRQQLESAQAAPASPEPRRKKARADDSQPDPRTPPRSVPRGEGVVRTDRARWQAALQSSSEFWGSLEPRLIDQTGELNYEMLLHQLQKTVRDEAARSRFMRFVRSDATGWHCVERVVDPGSESTAGPEEGKCTLRRHRKAGECLRMQRVGGSKVDFQYVRNK